MLDAGARRLLVRVSVFARGGNLEQLEPVCGPVEDVGGDVLYGLDWLADQSLLRRLPEFDEPRFLMLQTIRDFAIERLEESGEAGAIRDRHVEAFITLATSAESHLFGPNRREWLDRLEIDHDNFRAALDWCLESGNARQAMRLAGAFWRFWQMRGHIHEGRARMANILGLPKSQDSLQDRALALEAAGGLAYWQADMDIAQGFYDECLALSRQLGDKRAIANAIYNAAFPMTVSRKTIPRAKLLYQEALTLFQELGDDGRVARTLWGIGNANFFDKDYAAAKPALEEAQALSRRLGDRFNLAWSTHTLGLVAFNTNDIATAKKNFLEALQLFLEAQDVSGITLQLDNLSSVARKEGDPLRATRLAAAAVAQQTATGTGLGGLLSYQEGRTGREGLSEADAATAWAEGQSLSLDEAVAYAMDPKAVPAALAHG
jgi:tetratricopeptide (TPR) repeat protein